VTLLSVSVLAAQPQTAPISDAVAAADLLRVIAAILNHFFRTNVRLIAG